MGRKANNPRLEAELIHSKEKPGCLARLILMIHFSGILDCEVPKTLS